MSEWLNGIFECLDINSSTGLATEDSLQSMSPFQRLFYTQVHEKIGICLLYTSASTLEDYYLYVFGDVEGSIAVP